jgi:hypothetical protein
LLLDRVQRRDAAQRLVGDGAAAGGVHVEEFTADVGQASQFGGSVGEQGFVADEMLCVTFRRLCCAKIYVATSVGLTGGAWYFPAIDIT